MLEEDASVDSFLAWRYAIRSGFAGNGQMSAFTIMFKQDAQDDDEEPQELKVLDDARACARIAECDAECYTWWLDTLSQREKKERASALAALIMLMGQHNTQTARNIETQDPSVIFACLYQERCPVNICTTAILLKGLYCEDVRRREHGGRFSNYARAVYSKVRTLRARGEPISERMAITTLLHGLRAIPTFIHHNKSAARVR